jgi:hypothetical protein
MNFPYCDEAVLKLVRSAAEPLLELLQGGELHALKCPCRYRVREQNQRFTDAREALHDAIDAGTQAPHLQNHDLPTQGIVNITELTVLAVARCSRAASFSTAREVQHQVDHRLLLDPVVRQGAGTFQRGAREDQKLDVRRDAVGCLDLCLDVVDGVASLHSQRDDLASQCLHDDLNDTGRDLCKDRALQSQAFAEPRRDAGVAARDAELELCEASRNLYL